MAGWLTWKHGPLALAFAVAAAAAALTCAINGLLPGRFRSHRQAYREAVVPKDESSEAAGV